MSEHDEPPEEEEREETIEDLDVPDEEPRFITGGLKVEQPPPG